MGRTLRLLPGLIFSRSQTPFGNAFIFAPQRTVDVWEFIQKRSASRNASLSMKAFPTGGWERGKELLSTLQLYALFGASLIQK